MAHGKRIYSKRFPAVALDELEQEISENAKTEKTASLPSSKDFIEQLQKNRVFVLRPDKVKESQRFIALAKEFSEVYEIDMDIEEHDFFVLVDMYLYCSSYADESKQMLSTLLNMADEISFFTVKTEPSDILISLTYSTHECKKINHRSCETGTHSKRSQREGA